MKRALKLTGVAFVWAALALGNPQRVATCVSTGVEQYSMTGKQAATLCKKFKNNSVFTCWQQARAMGVDPDSSATLCQEADTLSQINCHKLTTQLARVTFAEAAIACSGDKP